MKASLMALALVVAIGLGGVEAQDEVTTTTTTGMVQPTVTTGECMIDVSLQAEGTSPVGVPTDWHPDNNIIVKLAGNSCDVGVSPTWTIAGWDYTFVQIAPNSAFTPPAVADGERQLVKLMRGSLIDANVNGIFDGEKWETHVVTPPNRAISMYIDSSVESIQAGNQGAVIAYIKVSEDTLNTPITDMSSAPVTTIAGPFSENLVWNNFGDVTDWGFEGVEFWNLAGILLQENDGSRLGYMQFWTYREDSHADGYHNHDNLTSENAFGEIHMAMYAANGVSGMQTTLPGTENLNYVPNPDDISRFPNPNTFNNNDQTEVQIAIPMPPGFAHGPLWSVDPATGEPTLMCSGGIKYPFHRWLIDANGAPNSPLRYSMWVAFEHLPEDVKVPLKMITEWPNAYLQSQMEGCDAEEDDEPAEPVLGSANKPAVTDGDCLIDVSLQAEGTSPVGIPVDWHPENNIIVKLAGDSCDVGVSPTWTIAGWDYTIVQIAPDAEFETPHVADDERQLVKLLRGSLIDVNLNGIFDGEKWETHTVTPPNRAISMYIDNSVDAIKAGSEGAVIAYIKVTEDILNTPVTDMSSSPVTDIAGPFSENLVWNQFGDIVPEEWGFSGVEFWNLAGILIQENDGSRLNNLQFWTFREDGDADNYHNHENLNAENAFGEIHMAMYTANGVSGMQTTLPGTENLNYEPNPDDKSGYPNPNAFNLNDQTEVQIAIPMPPGFAHGPLWSVDPATGEPTLMCSGGIKYPYHRWLIQSNGEPNSPLRYSMWVAFEHLPEDVTVPLKMITEWPNAYLQSTMAGCDEEETTPTPPTEAEPSPTPGTAPADCECPTVAESGGASFGIGALTSAVVAIGSWIVSSFF